MPSPSWERLDDFLQVDDFALTAMLRPGGNGEPRPVVGILEDPVDAARGGAMMPGRRRSEFEIDAARPTFRCKLADVADVRRGDTLTVDGVVWDVMTGPQTDGAGMATLELAARRD